jgi:hypothetical protein
MIKPIPNQLLYAGYIYLVSGIICLMPQIINASADIDKSVSIFTGQMLFSAMIFWFHLRVFHGLITLHKKFRDIAIFLLYLSIYSVSFILMMTLFVSTTYSGKFLLLYGAVLGSILICDVIILYILNRKDIRVLFENQSTEVTQES